MVIILDAVQLLYYTFSDSCTLFRHMNNFELCREICNLHQSVQSAGIIERAKLVAVYSRPGTPIPSESQFRKLFLQTEIIASITKTNVAFFGQPKFFTICFENSDLYFFLLSRYARSGILALQLVGSYLHEQIVASVDSYFSQAPWK